ncbi:TPA: hypothetical protein ACN7BE_005180, partial [Klebsiella pneumoniae]
KSSSDILNVTSCFSSVNHHLIMSEKIVTYTDQVSCFGKNISHRFSSSTSTTCNQQHKKNTPCPHKIRQEWLTLDEAAEVIRQHNITLLPADLIRHSFSWRNRSFCL